MKRLSNDPAVRLAECRGEPVPPVGGEVKVLACARLKVRELESGRLTVEVAAFDAGQLTERGIVPVYSAAHVTRLQADVETLKEYTAELKHQRDHWFKAHGQLQVSERTLRVERDALQSELTKARELLSDAVDDAKRYLASDAGWARYGNRRDHIEAEYDAMLAHQSSPAANCARCDASTVEHCDDKGCGFLGAGNGAPAEGGL